MGFLLRSILPSFPSFLRFAIRASLGLAIVYGVKALWQIWRNLGGKQ